MKINEDKKIEEKTFTLDNNSKNTFLIVENDDEEDEDNFGFHDLSFKEIYMNNKLFTHLITHLNSFLSKNKNSDEKMVINIQKISEFIKNNKFSDDIFENIVLNGIPNNLHCLRPLIWKSFIGYLPPNDLSTTLFINKSKKNIIIIRIKSSHPRIKK